MVYAPVIITTLNRYEHFKRCIESLEKNENATNTELYIGLDFPPSEKYIQGYLKIKEFLDNGIDGFKKVTIIERKENFGPSKNASDLHCLAFEKYDRVIFSEDDNVFAPNFLNFMNECLEKFKNNESIANVSGFNFPMSIKSPEIRKGQMMVGWGMGSWREKRNHSIEEKKIDSLRPFSRSFIKSLKCLIVSPMAYGSFVSSLGDKTEIKYGDLRATVNNCCRNYYCVFPSMSLVRNEGFDGTGVHCGANNNNWARQINIAEAVEYRITSEPRSFSFREYFTANSFLGVKKKSYVLLLMIGIIYCIMGDKYFTVKKHVKLFLGVKDAT